MKNSSIVQNNKNKIRGTNPARYFSKIERVNIGEERIEPIFQQGDRLRNNQRRVADSPEFRHISHFASKSRGRNRFTLSARYDMPAREIQPIRWHDKSIDNYVHDAHRSARLSDFRDTRFTRRVNRVTIPFPPDTNYQRLIQIRSLYTFD